MSPLNNPAALAALRLSDARWRAVVDAAVDGIIVIDSHGRIEAANAAAEKMFGYSEQEMIGENVKQLGHRAVAGKRLRETQQGVVA